MEFNIMSYGKVWCHYRATCTETAAGAKLLLIVALFSTPTDRWYFNASKKTTIRVNCQTYH